jgi:hypothetical protein
MASKLTKILIFSIHPTKFGAGQCRGNSGSTQFPRLEWAHIASRAGSFFPPVSTQMDETVTSLATHYRRRAEEIRLFARSQEGPAREKLLKLAEGYESAAKFCEQTDFQRVTKSPVG